MWKEQKKFPKAIIHVDGDAFFVACEVAKNPALKGKCVITGAERGIASALSYEAKARGATRGMKISDIRRLCPGLIVLPSDYETYSLYSERMYNILKRYTPEVDEYSIDECFADITGLRQPLRMSYEQIAEAVKHDLDTELGITFSVGLSVNKTLAKVASKWRKPSGLTFIPQNKIPNYLKDLPVQKVWGIGPNIAAHLNRVGVKTALEFINKDEAWVIREFSKPTIETWQELRGKYIFPITVGRKESYASISKTKTFTPPSTDKSFVFSQLSKNIENACIKLRRHNLFAQKVAFFLKTQEFSYHGLDLDLPEALCIPEEVIRVVGQYFDRVFKGGVEYRATGVTLLNLIEAEAKTLSLFGESERIGKITKIYEAVDRVSHKYGKHTLFLGSSFSAMVRPAHQGARGAQSERSKHLLKGETARRHLGIPFMGVVR